MSVETDPQALNDEIRRMVVATLMLQPPSSNLSDAQPLFGPDGLGLDSVDALQLVVALDKFYGLKLRDAEAAQQVLRSVDSMAQAVRSSRIAPPDSCPA